MNAETESELPPLRGTMAGIELSFPRTQHGSAAIHYGDDKDWWSANRHRGQELPRQDASIRDFMVALNRSTFKPVCSQSDLASYGGNFRAFADRDLPPASTRWLEFIFSPLLYSQGAGQVKHFFEQQQAVSKPLLGPLIRRPDAFGLRHISSDREGGPFLRTEAREVYDSWYVDATSWRTLIACTRQSDSATPLKLSCVHYFVVPELHVIAHGRYMAMADVADWREIENEFRKWALARVVSGSAGQ